MRRDSRMQNKADARAAGMVTSQTVRHSPRWLATSDRAIGVAPGSDSKIPTVKVYNFKKPEIAPTEVPVSSFRSKHVSTKATTRVAKTDNRATYQNLIDKFGTTDYGGAS